MILINDYTDAHGVAPDGVGRWWFVPATVWAQFHSEDIATLTGIEFSADGTEYADAIKALDPDQDWIVLP